MKKTLLLIVLIVMSYNVFAFTTQGVWRWRNDDGSETSATWRADQNTPITIASFDSTLRLRIELYNVEGGFLDGAVFEYSTDTLFWDTIKLETSNKAFVLAGTSPNVTDLEPTTHQLNGQTTPYTFTPGKMIVASNKLPSYTVGSNQTTEYEYVFKPASGIETNTKYYFRVDAAIYPDGYPSLTTSGVLPVRFAAFNVEASKGGALITWTTATEENNSHFDVERSNDGKNYATIATVKGNGTSTSAHSYKVFDDKPFNGDNYYRIKQYDVDGKYLISDIRALKIAVKNYFINVYPNPSQGDVKFSVQNYQGTSVKAILSDLSGKIIHQELINMNTSGNYKLNLSTKLQAGMYMLKLEGDGLSEKLKIVVQ
jgi:hypothetical protein